MQIDFRYYFLINLTVQWVIRLLAGVGIPYGSSGQLPSIKQYFAGGIKLELNSEFRFFANKYIKPQYFSMQATSDCLTAMSINPEAGGKVTF